MDAFQRLGLDLHSLVLYLVNFGLLAAALGYFLYKPLLRVLDERRDTVRRSLAEAEALRTSLDKERADRHAEAEHTLSQLREEHAVAQLAAEKRAAALMAETEQKREALMADARAQAEALRARVYADVRDEVAARLEAALFTVVGEKRADAKDLLDRSGKRV